MGWVFYLKKHVLVGHPTEQGLLVFLSDSGNPPVQWLQQGHLERVISDWAGCCPKGKSQLPAPLKDIITI